MKNKILIYLFIILFAAASNTTLAKTIYVAANGNDANTGTINYPFASIGKAVAIIVPGDSIMVRGGSYIINTTIRIPVSKSGRPGSLIYLFAYKQEKPIFDCSGMLVSSGNRGFFVMASYWHIYGLDIKGAGSNGMYVSGSYNMIEFCVFRENADTGLHLCSGASYNEVLNCDSYYNADPTKENADGFAAKVTVGSFNRFVGCRAWQNLDDGWDGYLRPADDVTTMIINCIAYKNGYLKDGSIGEGDGNGFKLGGSDDKSLRHNMVLTNCLAVGNKVKGFDQNNSRGSLTLNNCTAYNNGVNYAFWLPLADGKTATITNCISYGKGDVKLAAFVEQKNNSWNLDLKLTNADFISMDETQLLAPRKPDGSLPDMLFLHPSAKSQLIDAGAVIGLPFSGKAPDLGCFEYEQNQ
jgi:Right handed beta helix region